MLVSYRYLNAHDTTLFCTLHYKRKLRKCPHPQSTNPLFPPLGTISVSIPKLHSDWLSIRTMRGACTNSMTQQQRKGCSRAVYSVANSSVRKVAIGCVCNDLLMVVV